VPARVCAPRAICTGQAPTSRADSRHTSAQLTATTVQTLLSWHKKKINSRLSYKLLSIKLLSTTTHTLPPTSAPSSLAQQLVGCAELILFLPNALLCQSELLRPRSTRPQSPRHAASALPGRVGVPVQHASRTSPLARCVAVGLRCGGVGAAARTPGRLAGSAAPSQPAQAAGGKQVWSAGVCECCTNAGVARYNTTPRDAAGAVLATPRRACVDITCTGVRSRAAC
jgi:hypothetical protein